MIQHSSLSSTQVLFESKDRSITLERFVSDEVIDFLSRIRFGYVGTLYEHKNTREVIKRMTNPYVLVVRIANKIAITCLFSKRELSLGEKDYDAYYIRYLAADEKYHGRGTVVKFGAISMNWMRKAQKKPAVFYNFVEEHHKSSYRFVQFVKFKQIGGLKTVGFSRIFPRRLEGLEQIRDFNQNLEFQDLVSQRYKGYNIFNLFEISHDLPYYVFRKEGKIIAGIQPHKARWVLNSLPGTLGKIALRVVPHIPLLKRVVNPKDFRFLGFEGYFYKDGHVEDLKRLMEGVLHELQHYSALMWFDQKDRQLHALLEKKNLGLVYHFAKSSNTRIMASFQGFTESEEAEFIDSPLYISALDNL